MNVYIFIDINDTSFFGTELKIVINKVDFLLFSVISFFFPLVDTKE